MDFTEREVLTLGEDIDRFDFPQKVLLLGRDSVDSAKEFVLLSEESCLVI